MICVFVKIADYNAGKSLARDLTLEEVAMGFVDVANEAMCRPIRAITQVIPLVINFQTTVLHSYIVLYDVFIRVFIS